MSTTGGAEYLKYSSKGQPGQEDTFKNIWTELKLKASFTSVLRIPNLKSVFLVILSFSSASLTLSTKLGHPEPESNFFLLEKRAVPQQTQLYSPGNSRCCVELWISSLLLTWWFWSWQSHPCPYCHCICQSMHAQSLHLSRPSWCCFYRAEWKFIFQSFSYAFCILFSPSS